MRGTSIDAAPRQISPSADVIARTVASFNATIAVHLDEGWLVNSSNIRRSGLVVCGVWRSVTIVRKTLPTRCF